MAGIYIHIPFCKKRCTYCDFYTETTLKNIPQIINSIVLELAIRKNYLNNSTINTIYFGGGTPSLLNKEDFSRIFEAIYSNYNVSKDAEITFEANPDDLNEDFFESIKSIPFNRISIGIQSFDDEDLKRINRRHNSSQALTAVENAKNAGFKNISIDLIYGLPYQTIQKWEKQLKMALNLEVQHISIYGLTYEEGTALYVQREKGKITPVVDETMIEMYQLMVEMFEQKGFNAYEISNFCLPEYKSKHNTSYWNQEPYLGIGPSAHSYNIATRQWNISSVSKYIEAIDKNTNFFEMEELSVDDQYNDFVMVSLRTSKGLDLELLECKFGHFYKTFCLESIKSYLDNKKVEIKDGKLSLTKEGIQISNLILIDLMKV